MFPREQRACDAEAFLPHDVAAIRSLALHRPLLRLSTVPLVVMANIAEGCSGGGDAQSTATGSFTGAAVPPSSTTSSTTSTSPSATLALPTTTAPPATTTPADPNAVEGSPAQRISRGANGKSIAGLQVQRHVDHRLARLAGAQPRGHRGGHPRRRYAAGHRGRRDLTAITRAVAAASARARGSEA